MKSRRVHLNRTQLRAAMVNANTEVHIVPRGDGKTEGILAHKVAYNAISMPRSLGAICHRDYESMLTKTLPPMISGLARLGYYKDVHYFIGRVADKKLQRYGKWQLPYFPVLKPKYFIHWFNGSGQLLVSFNRDNSANGASLDYIIADEAKFLTDKYKSRFDEELVPAMRGNVQYFGKHHAHGGITFTTDQPTLAGAKWLFDYEDIVDQEQVEVILGIQFKISQLRAKLHEARTVDEETRIRKRIKRELVDLNAARMDSVFYHEPEPMANIDILGDKRYLKWKEVLPDLVFRTSILNERLLEVDDNFYPALDPAHHVVDYEDSTLENAAFDSNFHPEALKREDSNHDPDILPDKPLDIAFDWGHRINCMVVGQRFSLEYHISNAMYLKHPAKIQDLVRKFCRYYKPHRCKVVNLPYDSTAYQGHGAFDSTYIDEAIKTFREEGWAVRSVNLGAPSSYEKRYRLWNDLLLERDTSLPALRFNKHNTEYLIVSMKQAPVRVGRNGFEKNKISERDTVNNHQEESTHFSEAADTLILYRFANIISQYDDDYSVLRS